jgi:hypothetical protein
MTSAGAIAGSSTSSSARSNAIGAVAMDAAAIADMAQLMLQREEETVIPVVAQLVPEAEQKSFNSKVIQKLGMWDARLHLVGMHEAVVESETERQLFRATIPSIPQKLIPRWKRLLYEPRAGALDKIWAH